jgi:fructose 1,6-bisphosphatase
LINGLRARRQYIKKNYKENDKFIALFEVDTLIKIVEKYLGVEEPVRRVKRKRKEKGKTYKRKHQSKSKGLFY